MSFIYREIPPEVQTLEGVTKTSGRLWAVGFYNPHGDWQTESTHPAPEKAAERVHWLNGGTHPRDRQHTDMIMERLTNAIRNMPTSIRTRPF